MEQNSICCVIVTYNIGKQFLSCFNAIKNQVDRVVIIDNGSDYETIKVLKNIELINEAVIIYNSDNKGIAAALNKGVEFALDNNYEWLLTMDNDSIASENMVESMLNTYNCLEEKHKKGIVSIFPTYLERAFLENSDKKSNNKASKYHFVNMEITSGNLLKVSVFNKVEKFIEDLFIDYVDHEFCLRLLDNGYKLIQAEEAFLFHRLGESGEKKVLGFRITYTNHSPLRLYYITRNSLYTWSKYYKDFPKIVIRDIIFYIRKTLKILFYEEKKKDKFEMIFKGVKDYKKKKFGKLEL